MELHSESTHPRLTEQQQHFAWLEGVVWLLPLLAFYSRPKEKAASVRKVMNVKAAHRISYAGNEYPRNRVCNIDIDEAVDERGGRNPLVRKAMSRRDIGLDNILALYRTKCRMV